MMISPDLTALDEQSDQRLHCLPFHRFCWRFFYSLKPSSLKFGVIKPGNFWAFEILN